MSDHHVGGDPILVVDKLNGGIVVHFGLVVGVG